MTRRDVLGEQADDDAGQVLAGAKVTALLSGQQPDGGFGVHPYRKWTGAHWRAGLPGRAGHPPARAARGRRCRSRPGWLAGRAGAPAIGGLARARLAGQPAPPRPAHRRAHPQPRLHRGKRPGRLLPARPGRRPAGPLPGRIPDRPAMARRRVELRPGRHRAALLLPRVAGPGLGTARVRAGHRRSGRQGRGQPHRRAVPGPPDRQVFSGAPGPTPPRCGTGPRASRARRARWSARPRVLSPFR